MQMGMKGGGGALTSHVIEVQLVYVERRRLQQVTAGRGSGSGGRLAGGFPCGERIKGQGNQEGARGQAAGRPGAVG